MPRPTDLSVAVSSATEHRASRLTALRPPWLALCQASHADLPPLTRISQLVLYSNESGDLRDKLPASLTYLHLRNAAARCGALLRLSATGMHQVQLVRHGRPTVQHTTQQTRHIAKT